MSKKKKRRLKKSVKYSMAAGGLSLAVIGAIIFGSKGKAEKKEDPKRVASSTVSFLSEEEAKHLLSEKPSFINMDDFRITQGEQIMVTTSDVEGPSVTFASTNEDVLLVDEDGTITAVAPGLAAITVTSGTKTDSVIVEVVEHKEDKGEQNLPFYTEAISEVVVEPNIPGRAEVVTQASTQTPTQTATQTAAQSTTRATQKATEAVTQKATEAVTQKTTQAATQKATAAITQSTTAAQKTTAQQETSYAGTGLKSSELYDYIEDLGFVKKVGNVFVYSKATTADAQVIIESRCVHIYLKDDNIDCINAVSKVVALLLPSGYEEAMTYLKTDKADSYHIIEKRGVQIITRKGSGHSQIIIYN